MMDGESEGKEENGGKGGRKTQNHFFENQENAPIFKHFSKRDFPSYFFFIFNNTPLLI
jgi:hypothetical protein